MPAITDAVKPLRKHPGATLYWTMPFLLKENETLEASPAPVVRWYPSGDDYDLMINDLVFDATTGNLTAKVAGGRLHEHFIAEFTITTIESTKTRTRVLSGRIEIV